MNGEANDGTEMSKTVTFQVTTRKKTETHEREFIKLCLARFSGGSAQDWLKWYKDFERVSELKKWTSAEKALHLSLVLDDEALDAWTTATTKINVSDDDAFEEAYKVWGRMFVPNMYHERLEEDMEQFTKKRNETVSECLLRMREISRMLKHLPYNALDLDEQFLIRIFKRAMPRKWITSYEMSGVHLTSMTKTVQYFQRLEQSEKRRKNRDRRVGNWKPNNSRSNSGKPKNAMNENRSISYTKGGNQTRKRSPPADKSREDKWCNLHHTKSHNDSECYTQKKNSAGSGRAEYAKKTEEVKLTVMEDSESDYSISDENECKVISCVLHEKPVKKPPMRLRFRLSKTRQERVALVDTGCGRSYINAGLLAANQELGFEMTSSDLTYEQVKGFLSAEGEIPVKFRLMDLNYGTRITYTFSVIKDAKDEMVIGRDLLSALGMIVNFRDGMIEWNGNTAVVNTGAVQNKNDEKGDDEGNEELKEINDTSVTPEEMLVVAEIDKFTYNQSCRPADTIRKFV